MRQKLKNTDSLLPASGGKPAILIQRFYKILLFFALLLYAESTTAQSFSIYSVYRYGDVLSKEQDKKINNAEWHKQEAGNLAKEIDQNKRQIKVYSVDRKLSESKKEKKIQKLTDKNYKLQLKHFEHIKSSNALFYEVYKEKIDVLWDKYESDDEALVIVKAMEDNGVKLFDKARENRASINKELSVSKEIETLDKASDYEHTGLDMISSALEGYYNYELEFKKQNQQGDSLNFENNDELIAQDQIEYQYTQPGDVSEISYGIDSEDETETIIVSKDALIYYMDDEENLDLIMDNFDLDLLEDDLVIKKSDLIKVDTLRKLSKQQTVGESNNVINNSSKLTSTNDIENILNEYDKIFKNEDIQITNEMDIIAYNTENEGYLEEDNYTSDSNISNESKTENKYNQITDNQYIMDSGYLETETEPTKIPEEQYIVQPQNQNAPAIVKNTEDEKRTEMVQQSKTIEFRVQIAACRIPMPEHEIKELYNGPLPVKRSFEDDWYKYTIKGGNNVTEAYEMAAQSGTPRAFPVVYVNGIRKDIEEFK